MGFFNLFGFQNKEDAPDPYWEFIPEKHVKVKVDPAEYYTSDGFDFGWLMIRDIASYQNRNVEEIELTKSMSYGQKALYYWWYLDGQVTNGGFVQFYYNDYGKYVPTIMKGLKHIGDEKMLALVNKAHKIYLKNEKLILKAQNDDLFGSDLYDKLDGLSNLDGEYYDLNDKTMALMVSFIKKNSSEFCVDHQGNDFTLDQTKELKAYHDNKNLMSSINLKAGKVHGVVKQFYENGSPKEFKTYANGEASGAFQKFYENGSLSYEVTKKGDLTFHTKFHKSNGAKKEEYYKTKEDEKVGESKDWYDNGQLESLITFNDESEREGPWLKYHRNGTQRVDGEIKKDGRLYIHNCWDENKKLILEKGTGLYVSEDISMFGKVTRYESNYVDYERHGLQKTFQDGVLTLSQEMKEGVEEGTTKKFYRNGVLAEEINYKAGQKISSKKFRKFKNPIVKVNLVAEHGSEGYYQNNEIPIYPDAAPKLLNASACEQSIQVNESVLEPYGDDGNMSYNYTVLIDEQGKVESFEFGTASNGFILDQIEAAIKLMKFEVAKKNGIPIKSGHFVKFNCFLIEGE